MPQAETCGEVDLNCDGALPPACTPQVLTTGGTPWFLSTTPQDEYLYWTTRSGAGDVYRVKKDGTDQKRLYTGEADPRGLRVEADGLVWVTNNGLRRGAKDGAGAQNLYQLPGSGTVAFRALMGEGCLSPSLMAIVGDEGGYYVTTGERSCTGLLRITRAGVATGLATGIHTESVVRDGSTLFMGRPLSRMGLDGAGRMQLAADGFIEGIAVDASAVYVQGSTTIFKVNKDGSGRETLATFASCGAGHYPVNLAISERRVYWLEQCSKTLRAVDKDGKNEQTLYTTTNEMLSIILDGDTLYFSEPTMPGRVMKLRIGR